MKIAEKILKIWRRLRILFRKNKKILGKEKFFLNKKTIIYYSNNNYIFSGRTKKGYYSKYREINKKYKNKIIFICFLLYKYIIIK